MDKEKTILIVDDIDINRMILAEIFKDDYHILEAGNGVQALEVMEEHDNIVAVLLDLQD